MGCESRWKRAAQDQLLVELHKGAAIKRGEFVSVVLVCVKAWILHL
jgi:hypothetical protein